MSVSLRSSIVVTTMLLAAGGANAQWTTVGSNIYYSAGNVGVGVTNPIFPIDARGNGARVISAYNTANTGYVYGLVGNIVSDAGTGVWGYSGAQQGTGYGVYGLSRSDKGSGIVGYASADTWRLTTGVLGKSRSSGGIGVLGLAESATGSTRGVNGRVYSANGYAGYFEGGRNYFEGNVGIGTDSPTRSLETRGSVRIGSGAIEDQDLLIVSMNGEWKVGTNTTGNGTESNQFYIYDNTTSEYYLTVQRGTGNVGIGTQAPTSKLHVQTGLDSQVAIAGYAGSTGTPIGVLGSAGSGAGYDFYAAGSGVDYGVASSRRWKSNIRNIADPLDMLGKLRGVTYDWDEAHGGRHDVGFIAEEVGRVLPEIVVYEENGIDASGMDYGKMTPLLVEAVNALRAEKDEQLSQRDSAIASLRSEHESQLAERDRKIAALGNEAESLRAQNEELRDRLERLEALMAEFMNR